MARAIGDGSIGEGLLPYPHITQLKLPTTHTSRFILASDGIWDSGIPERMMFQLLRDHTLAQGATNIMSQATASLRDDTTMTVVEIQPASKVSRDHYSENDCSDTLYSRFASSPCAISSAGCDRFHECCIIAS